METSTEQAIKLAIVGITGLSRDALHIYAGLAVFFLSSILLRKPLRSAIPLLIVLALALLGEITDMRDDMASLGYWRWGASLHDVLNTILWPFVIFVFTTNLWSSPTFVVLADFIVITILRSPMSGTGVHLSTSSTSHQRGTYE